MSYETLFQRHGSPSMEAEINIRGYLVKPDKLTQERIRGNDESAAAGRDKERPAFCGRSFGLQIIFSLVHSINTVSHSDACNIYEKYYKSFKLFNFFKINTQSHRTIQNHCAAMLSRDSPTCNNVLFNIIACHAFEHRMNTVFCKI